MSTDIHGRQTEIDIGADPTPKDVRRLESLMVQLTGITGSWTIELEGSIDGGATWWPISTITTPALITPTSDPLLGHPWSHIRMRVTAADGGTPAGYVCGRVLVD
jgi:hypothetical protein